MTSTFPKQLSFFTPSSSGLWVQRLLQDTNVLWCVYANEMELHEAKLSIKAFNPKLTILIFPQWDTLPYAAASPSMAIQMQRQDVLSQLRTSNQQVVVLSTVAAVIQKTANIAESEPHILLNTGAELNIQQLTDTLITLGFTRVATVYQPGEFSIRGGVIDIFPTGHDTPYRIDLFGDEIETIHPFHPATQRRDKDVSLSGLLVNNRQEILLTAKAVNNFKQKYITQYGIENLGNFYHSIVNLSPISGWEQLYPLFFDKTTPIFQLFPDITFVLPPKAIFIEYMADLNEAYLYRKQLWDTATTKDQQLPPLPVDSMYCNNFEYDVLRQQNTCIYSPFKHHSGLDGGIRALDPSQSESVADKWRDFSTNAQKSSVKLVCAVYDDQDIRYLKSLYKTENSEQISICSTWEEVVNSNALIVVWHERISHGFKTLNYHIITASELFGERQKPFKKHKNPADPSDIISQATAINVGDLVVHRQHGIGRYKGLETIEVYTVVHDCLVLEYSDKDKLFLPVENIELLSRYGSDQGSVALDKLGGTSWQSRQIKVKKTAANNSAVSNEYCSTTHGKNRPCH